MFLRKILPLVPVMSAAASPAPPSSPAPFTDPFLQMIMTNHGPDGVAIANMMKARCESKAIDSANALAQKLLDDARTLRENNEPHQSDLMKVRNLGIADGLSQAAESILRVAAKIQGLPYTPVKGDSAPSMGPAASPAPSLGPKLALGLQFTPMRGAGPAPLQAAAASPAPSIGPAASPAPATPKKEQ